MLFGPSVVFVLGGPGAGKGTQCSRIAVGSHGATGEEGKGERMSKFSFWRVQRVNLTPMVLGCFVGVFAMPLYVFSNCEDLFLHCIPPKIKLFPALKNSLVARH